MTGDESWVFEYDPETKKQSMQWVEKGGSRPKKARMSKSKIKSLLIAFYDSKGLVHHEFVPQGQTVNAKFYLEVLERLRKRVVRIRPELARNGWILHHDNAPAHSSLAVRHYLNEKNITVLPHPPYSPDLAPLDFYFFPKIKIELKGHRYGTIEKVQKVTTAVLKQITSEGVQGCFQAWRNRWQRVVDLEGEYCEEY